MELKGLRELAEEYYRVEYFSGDQSDAYVLLSDWDEVVERVTRDTAFYTECFQAGEWTEQRTLDNESLIFQPANPIHTGKIMVTIEPWTASRNSG